MTALAAPAITLALTLLATLLVLLAIHRTRALLILLAALAGLTILLPALRALLVLFLSFQLAFALLVLLPVGILAHVRLAAVAAALAILAHDIFSYEYPVGGTRKKQTYVAIVPMDAFK